MAKTKTNVEPDATPLDDLKARIGAVDKDVIKKKVESGISANVVGLYNHLSDSGTGSKKLEFLLSLDFGKETNKKKIAEAAALEFDKAGYPLATLKKILEYAKKAGSK